MRTTNQIDYRKELDRLSDALDIIARYEDGDSIRLKQNIRAERDRLDQIAEEMEGLAGLTKGELSTIN